MYKNKKGFTLIELLAVIVILAVIALIAIPIIMNVINDSKEGAANDSMYGYVKAVELAGAKAITPTTDAPTGKYKVKDGNIYTEDLQTKILDINFKGTKPQDNEGYIDISNGQVIDATLVFDGIEVEYKPDGIKRYTIGEEVYFDPTGAVTNCDASKIWTPSNIGTTCYKWNVIKDNGLIVELLLDHNTTAMIAWNTEETHTTVGPLDTYNRLKTDTVSWTQVETLTSADDVTRANAVGGTYTIHYNGMKARLIGAQEVADIVKNKDWTASNYSLSIVHERWLYQNLQGDTLGFGYWTDTADLSTTTNTWAVRDPGYLGSMNVVHVRNPELVGIRPVVRVLKAKLS